MNSKMKVLNIALATGFISVIPYNVLAVDKESLLNVEWSSEFGEGGFENFESIIKTSDGGFVVVGEADVNEAEGGSRGDGFIIKYDKDGKQEWYNALIGEDTDMFYDAIESKDGGFYAIGKSFSSDLDFENTGNISNAVIVKYDNEGNQSWIKAVSDNGKQINYKGIIESPSGKIAIVGDKVIDGERTGFFMSVNDKGEEQFTKAVKIDGNLTKINDFIETKDGNFILVGSVTSKIDSKERPFVVSLNENGEERWAYTTEKDKDGLVNVLEGSLMSVTEVKNGELIVSGYSTGSDKDALIINLNEDGERTWYDVVRGEKSDTYNSVMVNSKNEVIVLGESTPSKDANLLKDLNISVTRYALSGEKIRVDDLSETINNISASKGILTEDDKLIVIGKSYKQVESADAKCEVTGYALADECIQADGVIMKVDIKDLAIEPEEPEKPEKPANPCEVNEKPIINAEDLTIYEGEEFKVFLNVTAMDKEDGDVTKKIVVVYNNVDNTKAGEYKVIYKVVDECGVTVEKERKVIVKKKPVSPSTGGNTEKPQTGDTTMIYAGLSAISALGLTSINKRKED